MSKESKYVMFVEGVYVINSIDKNHKNEVLIQGFVYNKIDSMPIKGAIVQIDSLRKGVVTDDNGFYFLKVENKGVYKITIIHVANTKIITAPIEFNTYTTSNIDFYMGKRIID